MERKTKWKWRWNITEEKEKGGDEYWEVKENWDGRGKKEESAKKDGAGKENG